MRAIGLVVVLVVAACTSGPVATISPTPEVTPTASPVAPSTSPSAIASPVATNLHCRLPVTWAVQNGQSVTAKAGFLTFPSGTMLEDPSAPATSVFYDRTFSKWLPVARTAVSPDGKRYAYGEGNAYLSHSGKLHVVDVATGVDRVIFSGSPLYAVVDFAAEGIYVTAAAPEGYPRGLYLQNPAGGQARLISKTIVAPAVGGGTAWGLDFNKADPSPGIGGIEGPMNRILRVDVRTGAPTPWYYRPGSSLYVQGFDPNGDLFVSAVFSPAPTDTNGRPIEEIWLVSSAMSASRLFSGTGPAPSRVGAVDSHGVWFDGGFSTPGSVWLYSGASMQMVAATNAYYVAVAGGCIP
jgi:hypothetical protein